MIKKLMIALMIAAMAMSCTSKVTAPEKTRPAWVQYFDERFEENGIAKILDWRSDEHMVFLWVDKLETEETCDHVAMMEIIDLNTIPPKFASILIINKENVKPGFTPCQAGYGAWAEYLKQKAELKNTMRRDGGI